MGLLDRIRSSVANTVSTARTAATAGAAAVRSETRAVARQADHYAGVIRDRALAAVGPAHPARQDFAVSIGRAFERTDQAIHQTVNAAASSVSASVQTATHAVGSAADAVQHAGRQVVDSGRAIVHAAERSAGDVGRLAQDAGRVVGDAGQVVVDAGRAAQHAATAALTGDPRELEAAHGSIRHARAQVDDAHRAVSDAHAQVSDLGAQGQHVLGALDAARGSLVTARDRLGDAGEAIGGAVHATVTAPRRVLEGVTAAVEQGGAQVRDAIVRDVPGGREMLSGADRYAHGLQTVATGLEHRDPFQVGRGLVEGSQGVTEFGRGAWQAGSPAIDYAQRAVTSYGNNFDVDRQVGELRPGESYELSVGANVHAEVGGQADGHIRVSANRDGSYTVNAGGAAGINGYLHGGGRVNLGFANASAGGEASARALAGANLELSCANRGEAQRASRILEELAQNAALGAVAAPLGGPLVSAAVTAGANALRGPSAEDLQFLREHTSAVELTGNVAGEAAASLGLDRSVLTAGVGLSGAVHEDLTLRLELSQGRPTGVTVQAALSGEVAGHVGAGVQWPRANAPAAGAPAPAPASLPRGPSGQPVPAPEDPTRDPTGLPPTQLSGTISARVVVENHFDFPAGVTAAQVQQDPLGTLRRYSADLTRTHTASATVSLETGGDLATTLGARGTGRGDEVTFSGNVQQVLSPEVLALAARGDFAGAAQRAGPQVAVSGRSFDIRSTTHGVSDLGGDVMGLGVEGTFQSERRQEDDRYSFQMSGTEFTQRAMPVLEDARRRAPIRP